MARILAIDYGKKRTGLAVTDVLRITANPLLTVETSELREWLSAELSKGEIDSGQLQFWFMFLMTCMHFVFLMFNKTRLRFDQLWKNKWIIVMAILFVVGDRALFVANSIPDSEVTVMTLLKRCSCSSGDSSEAAGQ